MFSMQQKHDISDAVEKLLLAIGHPEMPTEKPNFQLRVLGINEQVSWAEIEPNWKFTADTPPSVNPHNEKQEEKCGN
jgi:hypothetical protein